MSIPYLSMSIPYLGVRIGFLVKKKWKGISTCLKCAQETFISYHKNIFGTYVSVVARFPGHLPYSWDLFFSLKQIGSKEVKVTLGLGLPTCLIVTSQPKHKTGYSWEGRAR